MVTETTEIDLVNSPAIQVVASLLRRMPREATLAEIATEIKILKGVREALIEARAGIGVPHEELFQELRSCPSV